MTRPALQALLLALVVLRFWPEGFIGVRFSQPGRINGRRRAEAAEASEAAEGSEGSVLSEDEVKILLEGAARGDAESQSLIGRMCLEGSVGEPDPEQAAEWFLKAAEQGDKDGQYNLGMLLNHLFRSFFLSAINTIPLKLAKH